MSEGKKSNYKMPLIIPNNDPLGIKNITLGGAPPSLNVEAKIVERQWEREKKNRLINEENAKSN
jgi:hypothetical protein